ncbi:MAG: riboflavin synthase [Pseudomonadota bacterium]|nr:riboflavin synthase [Pseudomonadota bacterium]
MFTGIIAARGTIDSIRDSGGDWRIRIKSSDLDFSDVATGDSIAVSGVCLTALNITKESFEADVSRETLACTTLQNWQRGEYVNLEKALMAQGRLGGHIVSGHVDGIGELVSRAPDARSERLVFRVPHDIARYIAHKGSVCIDGVSLTVNEVNGDTFGVNIIPHTAERTTLQDYRPGHQVNIEVDVVSRYLERLLEGRAGGGTDSAEGLTLDKLANAGFTNTPGR